MTEPKKKFKPGDRVCCHVWVCTTDGEQVPDPCGVVVCYGWLAKIADDEPEAWWLEVLLDGDKYTRDHFESDLTPEQEVMR